MLESLHWDRALDSPEARQQLAELRGDSLRLFTLVATLGYLVWHFWNSVLGAGEPELTAPYLVAPLAIPTLVATWLLAVPARGLAVRIFLAGGVASTCWAVCVTSMAQSQMTSSA